MITCDMKQRPDDSTLDIAEKLNTIQRNDKNTF